MDEVTFELGQQRLVIFGYGKRRKRRPNSEQRAQQLSANTCRMNEFQVEGQSEEPHEGMKARGLCFSLTGM